MLVNYKWKEIRVQESGANINQIREYFDTKDRTLFSESSLIQINTNEVYLIGGH